MRLKLLEFVKYLKQKINSADRKAQNPFLNVASNPFSKPINTTIVWIESNRHSQNK